MTMKVKVPVASVIAALEKRLEKNNEAIEQNKQNEAKHKAELAIWTNQVANSTALLIEAVRVRNYGNKEVEITYKVAEGVELPEQPSQKFERTLSHWEVEEVDNAIRILQMTDDEFVNASTMKSIGKYL